MGKENEEKYEVDPEFKEKEQEKPKDPRLEIAESYAKREYGEEPTEEPKEEVKEEPKEELSGETVELRVDGNKKQVPIEDTVEIKINGDTRRVTKEKVDDAGGVELYQKRIATEEGHKALSADRKQLQQDRIALDLQAKKLEEMQKKIDELSVKDVQKDDLSKDDQREKARKYREALFEGDDEVADQAILDLIEPDAKAIPEINPEDLINKAAARAEESLLAKQHEQQIADINTRFEAEYKDVVEDKNLYELARMKAKEIRDEDPNKPLEQVMKEAGDSVMEWSGKLQSSTLDEKRESKRALNTPKAATGRAKPKPAPKESTPSEYVAEIRKMRGQGI